MDSRLAIEEFRLPPRATAAHKGQFGRVLVVAGSRGLGGAASLAVGACLRSGPGLVTAAVPVSIGRQIAVAHPGAMSLELPETARGQLSWAAWSRLQPVLKDFDAVALGPGLGRSPGLTSLVCQMWPEDRYRLVLDADGLNALSEALEQGRWDDRVDVSNGSAARGLTALGPGGPSGEKTRTESADRSAGTVAVDPGPSVVLTPHPGEMQRLWQGLKAALTRGGVATTAAEVAWTDDGRVVARGAVAGIERPETKCLIQSDSGRCDRIEQQRQAVILARCLTAVVVLKGAGTWVTDGQRVWTNPSGNPGMASGGSGDCLTGVLAAHVASTPDLWLAVRRGCFVHGLAGDLAAAQLGQHAMHAGDLLNYLAAAWKRLESPATP